jgi:antitoxin component YwqK of YwqJK toxin-antitoxin module
MKKLLIILMILFTSIIYSQTKNVKYEESYDLIKVTYSYDNGTIEQCGFLKDTKLHGHWVYYNIDGSIRTTGTYLNGIKVGTWVFKNKADTKQVTYTNGKISNVVRILTKS